MYKIFKNIIKVRCIWLLCFLPLSFAANAQSTDNQYRSPLKDILVQIESDFQVKLKYDDKLVEDLSLPYAAWRIRRYSLEETLSNVLAPFDLDFKPEGENTYEIEAFRYSRRPVEEGRRDLEYLSTLYSDSDSWEKRKKELRSCMFSALGLNPMPKSPDSRPIKGPERIMDGYTVQNIAIETLPGLYVAGSLYRPLKQKERAPVILAPNGHFGGGRYRPDQQYRCATLARMGAITFSYDLFAWGESLLQFDGKMHRKSIAHTVQALNSFRILDYLTSLKIADPDRIGITGGSGGGSQTMLITALDDRIDVSVPAVMVSSHFYGGCPCESGKPIHLCGGGTNNAELAAMAAPRPQLIISDGQDWTHTVPDLEFPFIQTIYEFYDKSGLVKNAHFANEGHDYGFSKRQPMYRFMAEHLNLNLNAVMDKKGQVDESQCTIEEESALYVFGKKGELLPSNAIKDIETLYQVISDARIIKQRQK